MQVDGVSHGRTESQWMIMEVLSTQKELLKIDGSFWNAKKVD